MKSRWILLCLGALLLPNHLLGQADQSANFTPPTAIYHGSDMESVSLPMRNVHVSIPLIHLKGRGLDLDINATFNNQTWSTNEVDDSFGSRIFTTAPGIRGDGGLSGGWGVGASRMGSVTNATWKCVLYNGDGGGTCLSFAVYANFITAEGSAIQLGTDTGLYTTGPAPTRFWSNDGTYMRIPNSSWASGGLNVPKVLYKDGVSLNHNQSTLSLEDTNGNTISCTVQACTDTVGRVVNFSYDSSGDVTSVTYQDSSGTTQTVNLTWQTFGLDAPWANGGQCSGAEPLTCYWVQGSNTNLITKITLANGVSYSFQYVMTSAGVTTGQIAKIILPTGGYIRYTYPCSSGAACSNPTYALAPDQEPWGGVASRVLSSDGTSASEKTWSYTAGTWDSTYGQPFTIADPLGASQISYFKWNFQCPPGPTRIDSRDSAGTLLQQTTNVIGNDQTGYTDPYPDPQLGIFCNNPRITSTTKVLSDTNQQSQTSLTFGSFGNVTDKYEYDWGSGAVGPLLRHTNFHFLHDSNSAYGDLGAHILDRVTSQTVYDGAGVQKAQTTTVFDGAAPASTSNVVQHDYANFSSGNNLRGNPTQTSRWLNTSGGSLTASNTYNDVGNVLQSTDPNGNTTSFSYTDNYYGVTPAQPTSAFATTITRPVTNSVNHILRAQYYFASGLTAAACGENFTVGATCAFGLTGTQSDYASFTYDSQGRTLSITHSDGGGTTVAYNEASLPISITSTTKIDSGINMVSTTVYDGLGRESQTKVTSDPSGTDFVDTTFDELGRKSTVSNPHRSTSATTDGVTTYHYDSLGRVIQVVKPDGSISATSFSGNCTTTTDEAGKQRKSCSDGLGRLTNVWEDPAGLNYETDYQNDALGNLLRVDQKGSAPSDSTQWRTRTFTYDSLSRMLTANNPESGTISYAYDANSNQTVETDARSVTTSFTYDALNRITGKTYTDGTFGAGYTYDQSGVWGTPGNNAIGRMVLAYDGHFAATLFSYDTMGRVNQQWDCPPSAWVNGGCNSVRAQYNLAGDLTQLTYPDGRVVTYGYNSSNQLDQVQVGGTSYWSVNDVTDFYPNGTPKKVTLGNGVAESMVLNQRLQPQEDTVSNSTIGTTPLADHTYNYGTQNNGNILSVTDNVGSAFTQTYTYDQINRLATANESRWGLSFTYDAWANRLQQTVTAGTAGQLAITVDPNNRIHGAPVPCTAANAYCYDAAGNLLNDTHHQYAFDGASRISQVDSGATKYTYDPTGDRVRKDTGTNFTEYYHFGGNVLAEQDQAGHWSDYIYAGGKRIAKADLYDTRLHASATTCNGCSGPYVVFNFTNIGDLNGHVIQAGEKMFVRQKTPTGMAAGVGFCFTNGNCIISYPVKDQDGQLGTWDNGTGSWHYRRIDLTPVAGLTINNAYMSVIPAANGTTWDVYYDDVVVQWTDGTVHPLYTRESSLATTQYGVGQTNSTVVVETSTASGDVSNPAQTTYYYHGDQIGSSRLMTSGSGWPVWQGTFLPYGEEYNAQIGTNHYKFTGKERDAESQLDYFGARYYSNGLGRFITPDWAAKAAAVPYADYADPQSLNLYTYVRNLPTVRFDPDGHAAQGYDADDPALKRIRDTCRTQGCASVPGKPTTTSKTVDGKDSTTITRTTTQNTYVFSSGGSLIGAIQTVTTQVTTITASGISDGPATSVGNAIGNSSPDQSATRMALQDLGGSQGLSAVQNSIAGQSPGFWQTTNIDMKEHPGFYKASAYTVAAAVCTLAAGPLCGRLIGTAAGTDVLLDRLGMPSLGDMLKAFSDGAAPNGYPPR